MTNSPLNALLLVGAILFSPVLLLAQAPAAINYQAVARNAEGEPLADQAIVVRLSVFSGDSPTTLEYEEQHELSTTSSGLFTLAIGEGTVNSGVFADLDWGSNRHHLQVELDAGNGFIDMGTLPFLSVPYALYAETAGSTINDSFSLPFDGSVANEGQTGFRIVNTQSGDGLAINGIQGIGSGIDDITRAAIWGNAESGHGVVGFTAGENAQAGVWGNSNQSGSYGVFGSATSGGIGGLFETSGDQPGPALITRGGLVGIGTDTPEKQLHVEGDLFVNAANGNITIGFPENGNQWDFSTLNNGEDLQFLSKENESDADVQRFIIKQNGQVGIGNMVSPNGKLEITHNSAIASAQLTLTESEGDFARLTFRNTEATEKFWAIAGFNDTSNDNERLNFYHSSSGNIMTVGGVGNVGIMEANPTARFHIGQGGQAVGLGLRIDDGINQVWDITHGFGLRLHYGGELRGFFNATTGAYTQSSDSRMKRDQENMNQVLSQVKQLQPLIYRYNNARTADKTFGFIAQEVTPLFPELVHYSEVDDFYGINYAGFSVVAIKAIQEQQAIIENQQKTIDEFQQRLENLERQVVQLSNQK